MSLYDGWDPPRPGWVCERCGFDYDAQDPSQASALIDEFADVYTAKLSGEAAKDPDRWRHRPDHQTWSALEYACHVRDCFALYDFRIHRAIEEERPVLPPMRRDEVVLEMAYNEQDPGTVASETGRTSASLSTLLKELGGGDWERVAVREGQELSVAWMARNMVHEARHHLVDIDIVLARVPRPAGE